MTTDATPTRSAEELPGEFRNIPLDEIRKNGWNPQVMNDDEFNALAESMQDGMIDPIQIVPLDSDPDGKKYVILGGEHRWQVAGSLGWSTIPCIVLTDQKFKDQDLQKFITTRMNVIHGKLNPEKFRDLYEDLAKKYDRDALQHLMGFSDSDAFTKLVGGVKDAMRGSGMSPEMMKEFNEVVEEIKTVDDLSNVLNRLFTKYGDTLQYNFMVYTFGGKEHLYVQCDRELWNKVKSLTKQTVENQVRFTDVLKDAFDKAKDFNFKKYDAVPSGEAPLHFEAKVG